MRDAAIMSQAKEAKQPQDCNDGIRIQNGSQGTCPEGQRYGSDWPLVQGIMKRVRPEGVWVFSGVPWES